MKRFFIIALLVALVIPCMAQDFRIGATAGINVNSPSGSYTGQTGANIGVKAELGFPQATNGLFLDFIAMLSSHGWESTTYYNNDTQTGMQWKATPYYLNIPVHIGYKFHCNNIFKIFATVGPYFNFGLFGEETMTSTLLGKSTTCVVSNNVFSDKVQERFGWGLGIRLGTELYDHWQLLIGYDWGMKDVFNNINMRNRTLGISCTYVF